MSTLSDHRTIIAALFLPTSTAAAFHPDPQTLTANTSDNVALLSTANAASIESGNNSLVPPAQKSPTSAKFPRQRPAMSRHATSLSLSGGMPSASIIDDLLATQSNRTATGTPIATPNREPSNPFASFAASAKRLLGVGDNSGPPTPVSQAVSSDSELERGRENNVKELDDEDKSLGVGEAPMYRRLSRKQSKGAVATAFTRDVSVGPWEVETNPNANGGLHNAVQSINGDLRSGKVWVGVLGPETDDISPDMRSNIEKRMQTRDSVPVWVKDSDFSGCYDGFCHQVLWPSLHYIIPDAPKTKAMYESSAFVQYKAVNEAFAEKIASIWKEGDVIWVNDYHLLLLPQLLRVRLPKAAIGFFLHVAFPSSEIFRCLAARESLLRGMLGADLIGFQTHSFARHFRQTVSRILSVEATPKGIQLLTGQNPLENVPFSPVEEDKAASQRAWLHGHPLTALEKAEEEVDQSSATTVSEHSFVDVAVFPMGIDVHSLAKRRREKEVGEWVRSLKERYRGMKMIVARDKLDEVQGVRQKFMAFERFLEQNKQFQGKVMLIQVALATSVTNELQGNVTDVISRINMKFSTLTYQPIIFFHTHDVTFSQYLALLTVADCFIVTSMREGMALRAHEFVECQAGQTRPSPLVLSEFTGSYSFSGFRTCLAINPWDIQQTADAILSSLTMSDEEAASRWADLHSHVTTQTAQQFASSFLNRTIRVNYKHHIKDSLKIPSLDVTAIRTRYHALKGPESRRLILVDLERTLWPFDASPPPQSDVVPEEAMKLLESLVGDERNEVWALSGLPVKGKLETIAEKLPSLGICAEHGAFMKPRRSTDWINMIKDANMSWMGPCMEILQYFTERTPHSFIDKREGTIVWRYSNTENVEGDRSWARRQAAEAQNHIYDSLGERYRLRIIPALSSFIILPKILGRTTAVAAILNPAGLKSANIDRIANITSPWPTHEMGEINRFDYILAIGSDESLMNRLKRVEKAETVYTGLRKSGGSNWRCEPEAIYRDLDAILRE